MERVINIMKIFKEFLQDLFDGLKKPGAYLIFDAAVVITEFLFFDTLAQNYETAWLKSYIFVFIFFCFCIVFLQFDKNYLTGLEWIKRSGVSRLNTMKNLFIYCLSPVLGGFAIGSTLAVINYKEAPPAYIGMPVMLGCLILYPLFYYLFAERKARIESLSEINYNKLITIPVRVITGAAFFLMSLYMLTFVYHNAIKLQQESIPLFLKPVVMLVMPGLLALIYMPARIHYFIAAPRDRGNRAWFIVTALSLTVYAATGIHIL